jgi:hypothetical protein
MSYDDVVETLSNYFKPEKNISYERHLFRKTKQGETETIDNFIYPIIRRQCNICTGHRERYIINQTTFHFYTII